MTDEELRAIEAADAKYGSPDVPGIPALVAEVRRLRGLVRDAETEGCEPTASKGYCPWCGYMCGDWKRRHAPECEAFTEGGDVR